MATAWSHGGGMRQSTARSTLLLLLLLPAGCRTFDDARVLQTLNQRGFGRKYVGDSNEVLTIGIRDSFSIRDPNYEELEPGPYAVRMDGVVTVPLVGEIFVAGFTTDEIAQAFNQRLREYYTEVDVQVLPGAVNSKNYFMRGETSQKGAVPFQGNTTVWDAVMKGAVLPTADLDDIYVIRGDPKHPLVIPVDLEKMLDYGDTSDNIMIREDDIIVVNPNLAGLVKNAVELILAPIQPVVQLATQVRNLETIYKSFVDDTDFFVGNNSFGGGYGGSFGGSSQGPSTFGTQGGGNTLVVPPGGSPASPPGVEKGPKSK